ncbi:MAG: hydrogenase maturation nickel metallochaperone HypA, partial [Nitrospinota bacterium]
AKKIIGIKVKLGALSHISADHFKEHFDISAKGSLAEHARLDVEVLEDINDPRAQEIILEHIEIEE